MELKNKVMKLYEDILEPIKERKIVLLLKYIIVDGESDIRKITTEIPIREQTIKKYIDDDSLMLKYLTAEELVFFRNKANKLLNGKNEKIQRLKQLILETNEKDIYKIESLVPITIETIKKYLNNKEKLEQNFTEEELKLFLGRLEPMLEKTNTKLQRLIKCVLVDGETNLDVIEKNAYIKIDTIKKHAADPSELEKYITGDKLELFLSKVRKMLEEREKAAEKQELDLVTRIIDDIFHTRYSFNEVCSRNFMCRKRFETFLDNEEYMNKNFPSGIVKAVRAKITENGMIRERITKDAFIIEDRINIYYAKDDLFFLNQFDNKRLNFAAYYLATGANLESVMKHFESNIHVTLGILSDSKLEQILKPQHYETLERCINIEKMLIENNLIAKKELVIQINEFLNQNNFDKDLAIAYFKIPECIFNKILVEIIKLPYASNESKLEIQNLLNINEEKKVK